MSAGGSKLVSFQYRTEPCQFCDDGRVYERDYGCTALTCDNCNGEAAVESTCADCDGWHPLNDEGFCKTCAAERTDDERRAA